MVIQCESVFSQISQRNLSSHFRDTGLWTWVQNDETGESYARTMTRFAAASIRSLSREENRFRLPLTDGVKEEAAALLSCLLRLPSESKGKRKELSNTWGAASGPHKQRQPEETAAIHKLQDLFFLATTDSVEESQQNRFKCPVLAYVACFAYNSDDTFKAAAQVTSPLAQWQFLLRCTALYHARTASIERTDGPSAVR